MMLRKVTSAAFIAALLSSSALAQPVPGGGGGGGGGGGTGDFSGPASSVDSNFVGFNGTGGKTGKDSGYGPTSFAPAASIADVATSQSVHAADVAVCKMYRVTAGSVVFTFDAASGLSTNGCIEIETLGNAATVTANAADTVTFAGTTSGAGGSATLPAYGLYRVTVKSANLDIAGTTAQGNGTKSLRATGSFTTGNAIQTDANGNAVDAGVPPGGVFASSWVANNWYPVSMGTVSSGANIGTTTTYWQSRYFDKAITISQVHVRVSTLSAGQNFAVAIYAADASTGLPTGSAICNVNTLSTALATDVTGNCSASLTAGKLYWFGFQASDTVAIAISMSNGQVNPGSFVTGTSAANVSASTSSAFMAYTTTGGTFGTWPTNPVITQTALSSALTPFIEFKVGSIP